MAVDGPDRGLYRPEHRLGWALPFVPLGGVQFRGCHVHVHFSPGRCSDAAGTASSHSDQPRRQAACAAAPVVLSRHARAAMATLEILPVNVGPHSHWLAPRPAHQCLDECRGRDRCKADSDGIAHSIRLQATVQRCRSFSLVCAAGAQDVCAITHLKSPWPVSPSLSALSSSHGRRISGQMRCSSYSSVWKRSAPGANASVDLGSTQTIGQLWEEYFADASQWCDNRVDKKNPRSPDFKHKVTRKALWIDGRSTPVWVKARLTPVTQGTLQCDVGHDTRDSQDTTQGKRLRMGNNGEGNTLPTSARERRQIAQGGGGSVHVQSASTTSEAIAILKNRLQQGMTIDSYTYVDVLKRCLKQKDLLAAKQVHDCIIKSGMDQNTYVGTSLLSVYIRCGRLQDARRVFDGLLKKDVISWKVMIGGYAERNHANDAMEVFLQMREENVEADEITYLRILKACGNPLALKWGKEVHAYIRDGGLESNVRVGTALLQMYAKCGCIKEARQIFDNLTNADVFSWNVMIGAYVESGSIHDARLLFDRMEERDVITWNVMIGAYAESGCGEEAYGLFLQMKREGLKPNAITYISILNACASAGALEWVKEVHGQALEAGLESDLRVGNALIHMYSKCGSIDDARLVFDRMVKRDVITWNVTIGAYVEIGSIHDARLIFDRMERRDIITWNVMIGAYAKSGCGEEAYRLFLQMKREGLKPDAFTYTSILNARSSAGALEWVKEVHGHAVEAGLESDVRVGNALIHMYSKSGSTDDARVVFDRMVKRDAITWNVTIGAYVEIGSIHDARLIFDRMERRDIITWNVMIGAYAKSGCGEEAYRLFLQMKREGLKPDAFTYSSILNACASAGALEWVKEVHGHALEAGLESDVRVGNALIHMYAKCGSIDDARVVFDRMVKRDVITWTVMIGAYAESGCGEEAYRLFLRMKREGLKPNAITYISILNACASAGALEWVKEVHGHAVEAGLESDLPVGNALVHMYAKCGSIDDARILFGRMEVRDVITWNVMIGGLAQHGCGQEALEEFRNMNGDGVKPDGRSLVAVLSACSHAGLLDDGRRLFLAMTQDYGIKPDTVLCNCMVDLLGRAGHLEEAMIFIRNMPVAPNGATWGALLGACRTHGNVEMAEIAAAESLKLEGSHAGTYVLLSNIYAAAGKWDQVSLVRTMMQERGIRKEPGRSWIEVDNKIHRFVVGDTSHPETKEIYAELNRLTERIKAEGYIPDTRLVLQNIDEEDKELALCSHSEKLAIAYGLMRTRDGKPIRVYKNLRVCSDCHTATKFISKVTGREIVARDANRFHHFNEGVCSCGDYW